VAGTVFSVPFILVKPASYMSIEDTEEVEGIVRMQKIELKFEKRRWDLIKKGRIERKAGKEECNKGSPVEGSTL
jgi:hypothetical protein